VKLDELEPIADSIGIESHEVGDLIQNINAELCRLDIGLEVWEDEHPIKVKPGWRDTGPEEQYQLGWCELGDVWELVVRRVEMAMTDDEDEENLKSIISYQSLLKADREIRIRAMDCIPFLIERINAEAESALRSIARAREAVEKGLSATAG
jgi:hypothetical protein